ncbi:MULTISPECIES: diacylglycerol kinase family protein [Streptomyces]|uniref:diacylglycerol kinase family protein n=1 Tax=Streptomyces TaxID=1883 RepID=UPI002258729C|nr:diacylglycerol kinase family protein [Streptomyces sp. NBC_00160]MCX5308853.1 diacylglycerol kinase family protein [Streptomyces sp. NBC_00160]
MSNARTPGVRAGSLLLLLPLQAASVAGLGLLVTGPLAGRWPLSAEDDVNRALADRRGDLATALSDAVSLLAGTESVIALALVAVLALLLVPRVRRWRDAVFLAGAVAAQSAVFLFVTTVVGRARPDVPHLDAAPPTSSFPSGHVGAATALFGGLAVLAAGRLRGARRGLVVGLLLLVPPAVAVSRVYRGMHHPSDVLVGLLNGGCTLLVMAYALLLSAPGTGTRAGFPAPRNRPDDADGSTRPSAAAFDPSAPCGERAVPRRVVVVRHPHGCGDGAAARVRALLHLHGYTGQVWTATTADEPAGALAAHLAEAETALVVVCGGDGTVRACADVLSGGAIPLAIVPCGTGNLLARNLGLPSDPDTALREALAGTAVGLDVGRVHGDGLAPTRFTVMAGAGFDAAMVRDASARLKKRLGWAAYVLSALRHLGDPRMRLSVRLDGGAPLERRARMVVLGNVGSLQGGLPLLPDARPDSGRLEVVLLDPRGVAGWLAAARHLLTPSAAQTPGPRRSPGQDRRAAHGALEYFSAERIDLRFARPQPRELDGDAIAAGTRLTAEVEPGALRVCLPGPGPVGAPGAAGAAGVTGAAGDPDGARRAARPPARTGRPDGAH